MWTALLPGQSPNQLADHVESIAHTWRVHRVEAFSPSRGVVVLRAWKRDPLEEPFPAVPIGASASHGRESSKEGHPGPASLAADARPARETADGGKSYPPGAVADAGQAVAEWRPEYAAVEIGHQENGEPWRLRLHGTHVLVAGVTGSGKGSVLWGAVRALLPLVRLGLVELWACDPKRMELSYGRRLFQRYASDPAGMVDLSERAADRMSERADSFAGRLRAHVPTPESPFTLVLVDELAFLTAYQPDRDLRKRAEAAIATLTSQGRSVGFSVLGALQDPRKEVMNIRNLFPDRIALRLDEPVQVDMVLGLGARDRGALADLISPDPRSGAGVGFIIPRRKVDSRTVGRTFTAPDGKTFRPSLFVTLTLPSYGRVRSDGTPVDPAAYDYRRAARDALHFSKLVDRFIQNLRRLVGFDVQYFAAVEP